MDVHAKTLVFGAGSHWVEGVWTRTSTLKGPGGGFHEENLWIGTTMISATRAHSNWLEECSSMSIIGSRTMPNSLLMTGMEEGAFLELP